MVGVKVTSATTVAPTARSLGAISKDTADARETIAGKVTELTPSIFTPLLSHVVMETVLVASAANAAFLSESNRQVKTVPAAAGAGVPITSLSLLDPSHEALPTGKLSHFREDTGETDESKFTPTTEIYLISVP